MQYTNTALRYAHLCTSEECAGMMPSFVHLQKAAAPANSLAGKDKLQRSDILLLWVPAYIAAFLTSGG